MNENPCFLFWAKDWLTDEGVKGLSWEEAGVYIHLLAANWIGETLPQKLETMFELLPKSSGCSDVKSWRKFSSEIWPKLSGMFFEVSDGRICNKRLHKELSAARERHDKAVSAGIEGSKKRWGGYSNPNRVPIASCSCSCSKDDDSSVIPSSIRQNAPQECPQETPPEAPIPEPEKPSKQVTESLASWNLLATKHGMPQAREATAGRRVALLARLREHPDLWSRVGVELAALGPWARSQRFWSLDWILKPANLAKLLEGNYRERPGESTPTAAARLGRQSSWRDPDKFKEEAYGG